LLRNTALLRPERRPWNMDQICCINVLAFRCTLNDSQRRDWSDNAFFVDMRWMDSSLHFSGPKRLESHCPQLASTSVTVYRIAAPQQRGQDGAGVVPIIQFFEHVLEIQNSFDQLQNSNHPRCKVNHQVMVIGW